MKVFTYKFSKWLTFVVMLVCLSAFCKVAFADPRQVEKVRRLYKSHGLDFFDALIGDQRDFMEDEKKHAKLELLADDARVKALEQLENLLKQARAQAKREGMKTIPMESDLLLRRGTMLSDRARTATYFQNNPFKTSKLKHPKIYLEASIKSFLEVLGKYPHHPRTDVVLFSIAYNQGELRNVDQSFKYYSMLVNKYGDSPLVGDARLAIAEILFDKRKFADAANQLKEIIKSEHPRLKNFALYKLAWTYYNMADLDSGILALEKVIDGVNKSASGGAKLELRKEALHDLVGFYAERPSVNLPAQATAYFENIGKTPDAVLKEYEATRQKRLAVFTEKKQALPEEENEAFLLSEPQELLFRLVSVYRDQGKHEPSMIVADQLLSKLEQHPKTVSLYRLRAESAEKLRRRDLVLSELTRLAKVVERDLPIVETFEKGLPEISLAKLFDYFSKINPETRKFDAPRFKDPLMPAAVPVVVKSQKDYYRQALAKTSLETFKDFANFLHGEWSKTLNNDAATKTLQVYDLAIKSLLEPWRGHALDVVFTLRHNRAQLRYALKRWDGAAADYNWLAHHAAAGTLRDDYLRGEIASIEAWLKESPVSIKAGEMHPVHARLSSAYDMFLNTHLLDQKTRELSASTMISSARLIRDYGQGENALKRMMFFSKHFNDHKEAPAATRDVIALLEKSMRWEELRDFSESTLELKAFVNAADVQKDLKRSYEFASLKLLEKLEGEKDWGKATKEFAHFATKNPDSPFAAQSLMKSANAALQIGDSELSIKRLLEATKAKDSKVQLQAWLGLEPFYRRAYQWQALRKVYENVLSLNPDSKTKDETAKNLKALTLLDDSVFAKTQEDLVQDDPDVAKVESDLKAFEKTTAEYFGLRFTKSNNNPNNNFKKKGDMFAALTKSVEKVTSKSPKSLKGAVAVWTSVMKAELLLELAETIDNAALPAVLQSAAEADRQSYRDTLAGQTKDLRTQALSLAKEAADTIVKIDSPITLDTRMNTLLERVGETRRFRMVSFAPVWEKRFSLKVKSKKFEDAKSMDMGLDLLKLEADSKKVEDARSKLLELARYYYETGHKGYAYATAGHLIGDAPLKDEPAAEAYRIQLALDFERLPSSFVKSASTGEISSNTRWNFARWLAQTGALVKKTHSKFESVFSNDDVAWFDKGVQTLLRPEVTEVERKLSSK